MAIVHYVLSLAALIYPSLRNYNLLTVRRNYFTNHFRISLSSAIIRARILRHYDTSSWAKEKFAFPIFFFSSIPRHAPRLQPGCIYAAGLQCKWKWHRIILLRLLYSRTLGRVCDNRPKIVYRRQLLRVPIRLSRFAFLNFVPSPIFDRVNFLRINLRGHSRRVN